MVVAFDMARELPRTLLSLAEPYQRGVRAADYELIVMDNGSPSPVTRSDLGSLRPTVRVERVADALPTPVAAANRGIELARGELIGMVIDGARLASPGLLSGALAAARITDRAVITAPGWHLGPATHMEAGRTAYDRSAEDDLLDRIGWPGDGYQLFEISSMGGSMSRGIFGPKGESNSLFMPRSLWEELGGYDARFSLPGGGLANHDLYRRACELPGARLIELLGEGTFHQIHGGAATSRRITTEEMRADYEAIRGAPYRPPQKRPLYVGTVHPSLLPHVERSARATIERREQRRQRRQA